MKIWWMVMAVLLAVGCGGGEKKVDEPSRGGDVAPTDTGSGDILVPEEKYAEIKRLFDRKTTVIGRCFVEALEAGEIGKNDKVIVTLSTTITTGGKPTNTRILKSDSNSQVLKDCVVRYVNQWEFPTLPKEVEYSHVYRFEEF